MFGFKPSAHLIVVFCLVLTGCASVGGDQAGLFGSEEESLFGTYLQGRYAAQDFNIPRADEAFEAIAEEKDVETGSQVAFGFALAGNSIEPALKQAELLVASGGDIEEFVELNIQADLPRVLLAARAMRSGDGATADEILSEGIRSSLGESMAALLRSAARMQTGDVKAATEVLAQQREQTFRGLVPFHAASLIKLSGDGDGAIIAYRRALAAPRAEVSAMALARLLEQKGEKEASAEVYRRLLTDAGIYSRAGRMGLARLGELEGEPRAFMRRAQRQPELFTDSRSLFALAIENFAWLGFEQAARMRPDSPAGEQGQRQAMIIPLMLANIARYVDEGRDAAHYVAAMAYSFFDTPGPGVAAAEKISPRSWLYTYAQLEIASALVGENEDYEAGIASLKAATKGEGGSNPQWALQLHLFYGAMNAFEKADKAATEAILSADRFEIEDRAMWRYVFARGAERVEAGRWEDAKADLERALTLAPDQPIVLNHLGYSLVERGEELERAFAMIEKALALDPQNGAIVDSLGWAHYQLGDYQDAIIQLERAVGLEPGDSTITDHLGDAYYMVGRERDARYEWARVLELEDADEEIKEQVRRKLAGNFSSFATLSSRDQS